MADRKIHKTAQPLCGGRAMAKLTRRIIPQLQQKEHRTANDRKEQHQPPEMRLQAHGDHYECRTGCVLQ